MQRMKKILGVAIAVFGSYTVVNAQSLKVGSVHNRQNVEEKPAPKADAEPVAVPRANPFQPSVSAMPAAAPEKTAASTANTTQSATSSKKVAEPILASNDKLPMGAISPAPVKPLPANNKPIVTDYVSNGRFAPVPLAGELNYYKQNNDAMLTYTKTYMKNFDTRLSSLRTDRKKQTLSTIDKILDQHKVPNELKYLAVIESALNATATSPAGAKGYWQFMAPTGRMMGLKIAGSRDDRTDLTKSTNAAAKYLTYLYDEFEDWLLVVASYNCGPRPVINAMKKTGKNDFWSIKKYLPKETQNHVMAFVATATIMERMPHMVVSGVGSDFDWKSLNINRKMIAEEKDTKKKGHPLLSRFSEEEVATMHIVQINKPLDLEVIASQLDIDRRQLGRWNYDYFTYLTEYQAGTSKYNLRIPKDKVEKYLEKRSVIEQQTLQLL